MDTKALRQKILDLAIRGKLVPQDPNDEPASVLLERIRAKKQQMVKEGKLKAKDIKNDTVIFIGEDNLHYEKFQDGSVKCIEDEIPFEIPKGWEWCRLSHIGVTNIGLTYSPADISEDGVMVLRSSNIVDGKIDLHDLIRVKTPIRHNQFLQENDILLCARNGSKRLIGKCAIFKDIFEPASFGAFMAIYRSEFNQFIYYFFNTDTFRNTFCLDDTKQINQLTQDLIKRTLLPLPPQAEQMRIIFQLDKVIPIIENIEQDKNYTLLLIDAFKSKILDLAIRGKLVPQDPNDEPASVLLERIRAEKEELIKQGKIKRDKKESVIFKGEDNSYYQDIPNSWMKTTLNYVAWLDNGEPIEARQLPYLEVKVLRGTAKPEFRDSGIVAKKGETLILVDGENSGEVFVPQFDGYMGSTFKKLAINNFINKNYIFSVISYYRNVLKDNKTGSAIPHLNKKLFKSLVINIPPLKEVFLGHLQTLKVGAFSPITSHFTHFLLYECYCISTYLYGQMW